MQTSTTRINTSYRISHFALSTFGTTFAFSHIAFHRRREIGAPQRLAHIIITYQPSIFALFCCFISSSGDHRIEL